MKKMLTLFGLLLFSLTYVVAEPVCVPRGNELRVTELRYPAGEDFTILVETDVPIGQFIEATLAEEDYQCRVGLDEMCPIKVDSLQAGEYELHLDYDITHEIYEIEVLHTINLIPYGLTTYPAGDIEFSVTVQDENENTLNSNEVTLNVYSEDKRRGRKYIDEVSNPGEGTGYPGNWLVKDYVGQQIDKITYKFIAENINPDKKYYEEETTTEHEIKTTLSSLEITSPQSGEQVGIQDRTKVEFVVRDYTTKLYPEKGVELELEKILDSEQIERTSDFGGSFKETEEGVWEVTFTPDKAEAWTFIVRASAEGYEPQTERIVISVWEEPDPDNWWEKYGSYLIILGVLLIIGFFVWKLFFGGKK